MTVDSSASSGSSDSLAHATSLNSKQCLRRRRLALAPHVTLVGILLLIARATVVFLLGVAWSAATDMKLSMETGMNAAAALPTNIGEAARLPLPGRSQQPELGFFSIIYSRSEGDKHDWRWTDAKKTCEQNIAILKEAGLPGLTVFSTNHSMRSDWDVYKLIILPQVFDDCPPDVPLCPKINFFKRHELWSDVASEAVFFLDADAQILSETFIAIAQQYLELPIDFAASPDVSLWETIGLQQEGPYNTGAYFMRLRAFHNADFDRILDIGLDRNRRASPSAPDPPPPEKKPLPQGEQTAFNTYLTDTPARKAVRKYTMPWKMHCRAWYVTKECWMVHRWYKKDFDSLPDTLQESRRVWHERTGGVSNRTANDA